MKKSVMKKSVMKKNIKSSRVTQRTETAGHDELQELNLITSGRNEQLEESVDEQPLEQRMEDQLDQLIDLLAAERHGIGCDVPEVVELSIVLPCLNQATNIGEAILKIQHALERIGKSGEILVADRGSIDDSVELAEQLGARVINVEQTEPERGLMCSAAGRELLATARGHVIVLSDAEDRCVSRWFS